MQASESKLTVWRTMHPPSSGSKRTLSEVSQKMSPYGDLYTFTLLLALLAHLGLLLRHARVLCFSTLSLFSLLLVWFTFDLEYRGVQSSEMLVTFHQATQHHIPDDSILPYPSLPVGKCLGMNLSCVISIPDWGFSSFSSSFQANARTVSLSGHFHFLPRSYPIHHSLSSYHSVV